jgi:hypothetical protein
LPTNTEALNWVYFAGFEAGRDSLWILSAPNAILVPLSTQTGHEGESVGLAGHPVQAVVARGSIWVAARTVVDRLVLATGAVETITVPKAMDATGIAVDPVTGTVWVANRLTPAT